MEEPQFGSAFLSESLSKLTSERVQWPFATQFQRSDYRPGDTVQGALVVRESVKAREVSIDLRYVDSSFAYTGIEVHSGPQVIHRDNLQEGQELPFSFQLPADALPNWAYRQMGVLFWAVGTKIDRRLRGDVQTTHPLPVDEAPDAWPGPEASTPGPESGDKVRGDLDVATEPDRRSLRRGEELTARVTIGRPAAGRKLAVGLVCTRHFDVAESDPQGGTYRTRRRNDVVEEWVDLDSSVPEQTIRLRLPAEGPFSYRDEPKHKGAVGFEWKLVAREDKQLRRDPRRETKLQVLP